MDASFDILKILAVFEGIIMVIDLLSIIFKWSDEEHKYISRLCFVIILTLINVIQLPIQVTAGKFYGLTIFMIIICFIDAIILSGIIGSE